MYAVQIHSLSLVSGDQKALKNRNIFLDVSSEGQRPRRYFMGTFATPCVRHYESIIHFSDSAVTVNLNYGPFRYHFLGVHTIYEFLSSPNVIGQKQTVTFGKRGKSPTFTLSYAISKVTCGYSFMLNEVTCLKQVSSSWRKDELYAEVEYNHSTHSIDRGARNKYELGRFSSYDVSSINSVHNFTFSAFSNFVITFGVKSLFSDHILSAFRFVPLAELLNNVENSEDDVSDADPAHPNDQHKEIGVKPKSSEEFLKEVTSHSHGLMFVKYDPDETYEEFVPLKFNKKLTRRVVITSAEGGSYEILFTLTIDMEAVNNYIGSPKLFGALETPSTFPEDVEARDAIRFSESNWVPLDGADEVFKPAFEQYATETINSEYSEVDCKRFSYSAVHNHVEVLIDGRETFKRYYEMMMQAQHSISILAWELSLSFGLVVAQSVPYPLPALYDGSSTWITLEDVLLSKAKEGTKIRIIVWRHELLSQLNRFLYLGEVTIEREVAKLEKRCKKMGIDIKIFHTYDVPEGSHPFSDPFSPDYDVPFIVIIAGNPRGLISCHHEKLLLIDAECPEHTVAFTGGFDIARGRYDQPSHTIPHALSTRGLVSKMMPLGANNNDLPFLPRRGRRGDQESDAEAEEKASEALVNKESKRVTAGRSVQPILPEMRFLWHDIQLLIKGPAARVLHLHFMQRWIHSFSPNPNTTKSFVLHSPPRHHTCTKHRAVKLKGAHNNCEVRLHRTWKGVFDVNFLFDMHKKLLQNARKFLYIEHQYPFQNFALAYTLCEALKKNPELQVIIVTPVKTDLPTGLVGELFDWSQDHIIDHLQVIQRTAPDRVGIYGLVNQDKNKSDQIRSIYVHSKLIIVDDEYLVTGSTNLDNVSFHYSSELSVSVFNKALARETRIRLFKEHLGHFYEKEMDDNFDMCFRAYHHIASLNLRSFAGSTSEQTILHGRPVFMAPEENYQLLLKKVYYPNKFTKFLSKMGVSGSPGDDLKQMVTSGYNKVRGLIKMAKL